VVEENKLRDPDDVYISVRQREDERLGLGLAPRIRFLDQTPAEPVSEPTDPPKRKAK
jgi:hypothetical protein